MRLSLIILLALVRSVVDAKHKERQWFHALAPAPSSGWEGIF